MTGHSPHTSPGHTSLHHKIPHDSFDFSPVCGIFPSYSGSWDVYPFPRDASLVFTTLKSSIRINGEIRARELRVIAADGSNLGVISRDEALKLAHEAGLDLLEISADAVPPIAKIADYGKYQYEMNKKAKEVKARSHVTETKGIQIKVVTSDGDLAVKAKRVAEWLSERHRVKVDLFLSGRYKYMDAAFLTERLERFLKLIPGEHRLAEPIKKSPKGFSTIIEPVKK